MLQYFQTAATSWPFAIMFVAACVAGVGLYITRSIRLDARETRETRISTARDVTPRRDNDY